MGYLKGQNLRLFVGGKVVAAATSCTVNINNSLEDASTKDSDGSWTEQELVGKSWSATCDALWATENDVTDATGAIDLALANAKVTVSFQETASTAESKNRTAKSGGATYTGSAWIESISINAGNKQNVSYSISLTGDGALTKGS